MPTNRKVELVHAMRNGARPHSEYITRDAADKLVARGHATWLPGLNKIVERSVSATGHPREWRKTPSAGFSVMQLVPIGSARPKHRPVSAEIG